MHVRRLIQNDDGQSLVEFGLTIGIFMMFLYGLLGIGLWGISAFLTQETAHAVARTYAGTNDLQRAVREGDVFMNHWAYPFVESHNIEVSDDGEVCTSEVTAVPRASIRKLFIFQEDYIERESRATMAYALRYNYQFTGD